MQIHTTRTIPESADLVVRPVHGAEDLEAVYRLVHDVYSACGYVSPRDDGRLVYCEDLAAGPETTVFTAELGGEVVGTATLTLDGHRGLHVDEEYGAELARLRGEGRRLACGWRLAIRASCRDKPRVLLALFRECLRRVRAHGVETFLVAVVPHLAGFYRRRFGFEVVGTCGEPRPCSGEDLAAFRCRTVLLRWDARAEPGHQLLRRLARAG